MADGRVIRTGTRARKSAAGYDLTRLFVGSEGTLGVITEVTLRLHPVPEAVVAVRCAMATLAGAIQVVIETIQMGASVARIELLDEAQVEAINRFSGTAFPVLPTLLVEFHGMSRAHVAEQMDAFEAVCQEHGVLPGETGFERAQGQAERDAMWKVRHNSYYASKALRPGSSVWPTDVCVPISRLGDCILETKKDLAGAPFPVTLIGHVGDGNFHLAYMLDPAQAEEVRFANWVTERMTHRALAMGGTCTGEHGVGMGKQKYMAAEHGEALEVMRGDQGSVRPARFAEPG